MDKHTNREMEYYLGLAPPNLGGGPGNPLAWKHKGRFYCPFCGHTWKDTGISKCNPPVYIAACPECLAFGFPCEVTKE